MESSSKQGEYTWIIYVTKPIYVTSLCLISAFHWSLTYGLHVSNGRALIEEMASILDGTILFAEAKSC